MIDLINKEKNDKLLKDLQFLKNLVETNESQYKQQVIDEETYKLQNIFIKEKLDEIEKELNI